MADPFGSFLIAMITSGILAYPTLLWLRRAQVVGLISPYLPESHQEKRTTPTMAGIFVVAGIVFSALISPGLRGGVEVATLLFLFTLIGVLDDWMVPRFRKKRGLSWKAKLGLQVLAVALFLTLFRKPEMGWEMLLSKGFFILMFSNAVNFTDGLDGLATALLILAVAPFVVWQEMYEGTAGWIPAAMAGALLPFLAINAPPAKAFMGDAGSLPIGALYGYVFASSPWQTSLAPWLVSGIFLVELWLVPIQLAAVKAFGRRVFPATPIHHGFEVLGIPETKIVWWFVCAQIFLCVLALRVGLG
ncbi:MAG: hypothetical protein K6T17_06050 [Fimbriimonadales bacterium]|nr:hypothetical protein [Fimbriimonadales bacterium]